MPLPAAHIVQTLEDDIWMSEKKPLIQFISPDPLLANILRRREPIVVSREGWDWGVDWVQEVGVVMRDRGFISYTIASTASYSVILAISELFPVSRRLGILSKALGIA